MEREKIVTLYKKYELTAEDIESVRMSVQGEDIVLSSKEVMESGNVS